MVDVVPASDVDEPDEWVVTLWVHYADFGARQREMRMVARTPEWAAEVASAWATSTALHVVAVEVANVDLARAVDAERKEEEERRKAEEVVAAGPPRREAWWRRVLGRIKPKGPTQ